MGYKFSERFFSVEIEDVTYPVLIDKDKLKNCSTVLSSVKDSKDEAAVCKAIDSAIDGLLGDGSAENIFRGRKYNFLEHFDVLVYIYGETVRYVDERAGAVKNVSHQNKSNRNKRHKNAYRR